MRSGFAAEFARRSVRSKAASQTGCGGQTSDPIAISWTTIGALSTSALSATGRA